VWRFDRFARSVSHLLRALDTFNSLGTAFCSLSEALDTATPAGRMVFTVLASVAELERSLIRERVIAGVRNAQRKGKHCGRPRLTDVSMSTVIAERAAGKSIRQIASELGTSVGTIHRLCSKSLAETTSASC
jgi:DNA invertase Pin-like site-specific DNA recombinase